MAAIGVGLGPLLGGLLLEWSQLGVRLHDQRPGRGHRARRSGSALVPGQPRPGARRVRPRRAMLLSIAGARRRSSTASSRRPNDGWTASADPRPLRARPPCSASRSSPGSAARPSPMLDLELFRNPRFASRSLALELGLVHALGAIFAMTQYLQDAHGYSRAPARARRWCRSPLGLVMGVAVSSISSSRGSARRASSRPGCCSSPACSATSVAGRRGHGVLAARPLDLRRRGRDGLDHGARRPSR